MSSFTTLLTRGFRTHWARNEFPSLQPRTRFYSPSPFNITFRRGANGRATFFKAAGVAGIGFGLSKCIPRVNCDAPLEELHPVPKTPPDLPPPPASTVSLYQLTFGTVSGICAGIFIKKGVKAAAWLLGGIFVLLQYLASRSLVRVDWGRMATRFEDAFYSPDASGSKRVPTITSLWTWLVDFLTADFQPRASFIAGLVLGLRVG